MLIKKVETIEGKFVIQTIPTQTQTIVRNKNISFYVRNDKSADMPDIDFDVGNNDEVKRTIVEMWGEDNVVSISNWNTLQLKSLIKDISKFYGIPYKEVNDITTIMFLESVPEIKKELGIKSGVLPTSPTFEQVLKYSESFRKFLGKYPQIEEHVANLFRQVRSCGRHAGGLLVGEDLPSHMPLIYSGGVRQSPWSEGQNVRHLEPMGFIKFDILGLGTLRMFENCIKLILKKEGKDNPTFVDIKEFYNTKLHPNVIDFDDQKVYENVFHKGKWAGIFQFDASKGMQHFTKQAKPRSLIDLSVLTSVWRPGCLSAQVDKRYLSLKEFPEKIVFENDILEKCLKKTYGLLIFQEQLASLVHSLGKDISLNDANLLRKVLTKKGTGKEAEVKNRLHNKFIDGCAEKGMTKDDAEKWWQDMVAFNGYAFNKCIHGSSLVETREGKKEIKDVKIGEEVNSVNGFVKIKSVYQNGKKKLYKIKTASGKTLTCTFDHKLQTCEGMKTLEEIISRKLKVVVKN